MASDSAGVSSGPKKKHKTEQQEFVEETVKMFLKANIPIHKVDDPAVRAYMTKYIPGSGDLPKAATLRTHIVPRVGETMQTEIKEAVRDQKIVVVADETTDTCGRCVFAVLFHTLTASSAQCVYLASCLFLSKANGTTCSQAILDTVNKFEISFDNVVGIVSDSARYMGTCFQALKTIFGEQPLHFKCWAHKVKLVGDCIAKEFEELNSLVAKMKTAFLHSRKIKNAYIAYLEEHCPHVPAVLFLIPVVTRWNSWFNSVQYLAQYIIEILKFFSSECEFTNSSIEYIFGMFKDSTTAFLLRVQIKFVSEICVKIKAVITDLEGSEYPYAHIMQDELETLQRCADGSFLHGTIQLLNQNSNAVVKEGVKGRLKTCMQKCLLTLAKHMAGGASVVYKNVGSLFNPTLAGPKNKVDEKRANECRMRLPFLNYLSADDFTEGYLYFHQQLLNHVKEGDKCDVIQILLAVKLKYPEFSEAALRCVWLPVSSVDAERFFSKYNLIFTDRRTRMTENTIATCSMLSFNHELS